MSGDEDVIKHYVNRRLLQVPPDLDPRKIESRRATLELDGRRTTKGMLRKAMKIYDFERASKELSEEDILALEKNFGVDDIHWPSEGERLSMIHHKMRDALQSLLMMYG